MACCILVAMMFALPFVMARSIYGLLAGSGNCSMAWRPEALSGASLVAAGTGTGTGTGNYLSGAGRFTVDNRLKSFAHAGRGAFRLLRFEHSAWIQMTIAGAAIALGLLLQISADDWRWIVLACGLVLSVEGMNTAIESTCDRISVSYSEQIKIAKDVAAGAVLISSIAAALIGLLTFWPYLDLSHSTLHKAASLLHSDASNAVGSAAPFNPADFLCSTADKLSGVSATQALAMSGSL